jgi:hypothetical protein
MIATCAAKLWIHGYTGKARCRRCASQHAAGTKQTLDQNLGFQVTSRGQVGFDRFWLDVLAAVIRGHSVCPYIEPKCLFRRHPWSSSRSQERLVRSAVKARGQVKTLLDRPRSTAVHCGPAAVKRNPCLLPPLLLERRAFRAALAATVATSVAPRRQRPASPRLPFLLEPKSSQNMCFSLVFSILHIFCYFLHKKPNFPKFFVSSL